MPLQLIVQGENFTSAADDHDFIFGARLRALTASPPGKVCIGVLLVIGVIAHVYSLLELTLPGVVILCLTFPVISFSLSSFARASVVKRLAVTFEWVYLLATATVKFVMEVWLLDINHPPYEAGLIFINACLLVTYGMFLSIDAFEFHHMVKRGLLLMYVALNFLMLVQNRKLAYVDHDICLFECATLLNIRGHCLLQLTIFGLRFLGKSIRHPQAAVILRAPVEIHWKSARADDMEFSAADIGHPLLTGADTP